MFEHQKVAPRFFGSSVFVFAHYIGSADPWTLRKKSIPNDEVITCAWTSSGSICDLTHECFGWCVSLDCFFLTSGYSEFHSKLGAAFDISQIWFVRTGDRFSSKSPLYQSAFNSNLFWTIWVWRSWVGITADGAPLLRKSQFWAQCHYMFGCQGWSILLLNHRGATIGPLSMFFFVWRSMFSLFFCYFDHRM